MGGCCSKKSQPGKGKDEDPKAGAAPSQPPAEKPPAETPPAEKPPAADPSNLYYDEKKKTFVISDETAVKAKDTQSVDLIFDRTKVFTSHVKFRFQDSYTQKEKLGEGLRGVVYRSHTTTKQTLDEGKIRYVAGKCYRLGEDKKGDQAAISKLKGHFEDERSILSQLQHPQIGKIYEAFDQTDQFWIVLEFLPGGDLIDFIIANPESSENRGLKKSLVRWYFRQMLYAFGYLEARRIVHRDVKANNFLLAGKTGVDSNVLKLCDFDTAVQLSDEVPRAPGNVGTPSFSAPEVHQKRGASLKSDGFSVGLNLYIMLIGLHPFKWDETEDTEDIVTERILKCSEHKECDEWKALPLEDQTVVEDFIILDEEARLTARDALKKHDKWLWELDPKPKPKIAGFANHASELLKLMNHYVTLNILQRTVLALCAQMMPESRIIKMSTPWYDMFLALDTDYDGILKYEELTKGLGELFGSKAPSQKDLDVLVRGLDLNKSGAVTWDEWTALSVLSMKEVAKAEEPLRTVFRLLDRPSGDNSIDVGDILALLNGKQEASDKDKAARILNKPSLSLEDLGKLLTDAYPS
jgi:serine/threonine protein kinase